jgi:hypothetical protein
MSEAPGAFAAVIPAGQALSQAIDMGLSTIHRIEMPDTWTAAGLTFRVSFDGQDFDDLYVDNAEYVVTAAAADRAVVLDQAAFYGVRRVIVRSGTAASPVIQAAERTLWLAKAPR